MFRRQRVTVRRSCLGQPAGPIAGLDPGGDPVTVDPEGRRLYFLTSSCAPCRPVWGRLEGQPVVVVTPDPSTESRRRVAELAPPGPEVVMSSDAWFRYAAGPAPWTVTVEGGLVTSEGPA